jgi:hypothetical protein
VACPANQVCDLGLCKAACTGTRTNCNRSCVDVNSAIFHCGECGKSCGDANICTGDSCSAGVCANLSGAIMCDDGNPCTKEQCDPKTGCPATPPPITLAELIPLCQQLNPTFDPTAGCIYCDPDMDNGALCKFHATGLGCFAAPAYNQCLTCQDGGGTNMDTCDGPPLGAAACTP